MLINENSIGCVEDRSRFSDDTQKDERARD